MNIDVKHVGYSRELTQWLHIVLREPSIMTEMPLYQRNLHWVAELVNRLMNNEIMMVVGSKDGIPGGLFWGSITDGSIMLVHFAVMPNFRGWSAFKMSKMASDLAFDLANNIDYQMGFIRKTNKRAIICGEKAGFKDCGIMPNYLLGEDCSIMIRKRDNEQK